MNWKHKLGAVLAALAFLALPAAAASATLNAHAHHTPWGTVILVLTAAGAALAGTVTVTWANFAQIDPGATYTGGTTAPTAGQATQVPYQAIQVACTDADTTITLTHNYGVTTAQAAAFQPQLIGPLMTVKGAGTLAIPQIAWAFSTNTIVGTKDTTAGSGCTFVVYLRKPAP